MAAADAADAMARGVRRALPAAEAVEVPMSDGGEGFTEAVAAALGATVREVPTVDALGRPVRAGIAVAGFEKVKDWLAEKGYDKIYGARPLRRTIQERIEDKLAEGMLDGVVKDGDTARFVMREGEPVLETAAPQSL